MTHDHAALVERLRRATLEGAAETPAALRAAVAERAAGGAPIAQPYDALARQIGEAAYRVTDAQVDAVRAIAGTERATFEIVAAATLGAGLARWRAGMAALEEAGDAAG
jgi:hypothetical protein